MKDIGTVGKLERWRVALLDAGNFTPAYDVALVQDMLAGGHQVRLVGKFRLEEVARHSFRHEHFYRALSYPLARRLPRPLSQFLKGALHALEMKRLANWLDWFAPDAAHVQWSPLPVVDRLFLSRLQRRGPLVVTVHDSNPYNGAAGAMMRLGYMA